MKTVHRIEQTERRQKPPLNLWFQFSDQRATRQQSGSSHLLP